METIMQYIPLAVSAILLAALILTVITNIITQVVKKNHLGQDPHQHFGGAGGHGRDPAGVLCGVPDHGLGRHLVHGGRRGGPGPVRVLCGHVRV